MVDTTCRQCGATGTEGADDPCPGLCPNCFADRMQAAVPFVQSLLLALSSGEAIAEARKYLRGCVELTEAATEELLAGLRREAP